MATNLSSRILAYCQSTGRQTYRRLGDGADGIVFEARINVKTPGIELHDISPDNIALRA